MRHGRARAFVATRTFHGILLFVGTLFLLTGAFHGNVWFDESYSVGIANHSFSEIWRIGSGDVHPVLFYEALHVLNVLFGQNILVYRLFTVAGAVALAALGLTHLRRDFGWRVGVIFTFLALFTPYVSTMAIEIRMYSWATFTVMLCALSAWRIFSAVRKGGFAPARTWVAFFLASLASAYLQYFGVLSAFVINVLLFAFFLHTSVRNRQARRMLGVFVVGAVAQVLAYLPWLMVLAGQMGVVSGTYWAKIVFPTTYIELATYPVLTSQISFATRGAYGLEFQVILNVLGVLACLWVLAVVGWLVVRGVRLRRNAESERGKRAARRLREREEQAARAADLTDIRQGGALRRFGRWVATEEVLPVVVALGVYGGVFLIAWVMSLLMGSLILYYRYLFVAIGPLLFATSFLLARVKSQALLGSGCALLLGVSLVHQVLLVRDCYAPENKAPLERFAEVASEADLVISSDIGFEGVTAVTYPDIPQTYMDWQKGNWGLAYEAYAPTLTSQKSWELILDDFHGTLVVLGQSQKNEEPRCVRDLKMKPGLALKDQRVYYRPYERTYFTVAVMEKR